MRPPRLSFLLIPWLRKTKMIPEKLAEAGRRRELANKMARIIWALVGQKGHLPMRLAPMLRNPLPGRGKGLFGIGTPGFGGHALEA